MRVKSNKIDGVPFTTAAYIGAEITPTIVVLHDTAGRLEKGNSAAYLASKNSGQVSVHFVIERDGSIVQQVPTNRRANHAGISSFNGRSGCNGFSIGIEIVNPGRMTWADARQAEAWWGQKFSSLEYDIRDATTPEHGKGAWMAYTPQQIEAVTELLRALFAGIPTLTDITTHWYISPGRKADVNPWFPLDRIKEAVLGHDDPADIAAEAQSDLPPISDLMVRVVTQTGSGLNMRRWPSLNPNIIASIPNGTVVPVSRQGTFDGRRWYFVLFDGLQGWVAANYTTVVHPNS